MEELMKDWKSNWRSIQSKLDINHRICPECGKILYSKCFTMHLLRHHGISKLEYVLRYNNLTEVPKCANPYCNNKVGYDVRNTYGFAHTCSPHCKSLTLSLEGKHHFNHDNLILDNNGKSILHRNAAISQISNKSHAFCKDNLIRDDSGKSIIHSRRQSILHKEGRGNMQYWDYDKVKFYGYTYKDVLDHNSKLKVKLKLQSDKLIKLMSHSGRMWISPIELKLGELLKSLNYNVIPQYEVHTFKTVRYIDYYLPDINLGIECDGMFKTDEYISNRKREIESSNNIKLMNIRSIKIYKIYLNNIYLLKRDIENYLKE